MKTQDPFTSRTDQHTAERRDGNRARYRQAVDERGKYALSCGSRYPESERFEDETRTRGTPNSYS